MPNPLTSEDRARPWSDEMMRDFNYCLILLEPFFPNSTKAALWMNTPNPMLGDVAPKEMIRHGRTARLVRFIQVAEENRAALASSKSEAAEGEDK